jgi:hypothetical protein
MPLNYKALSRLCMIILLVVEIGGLYACGFIGQPAKIAETIPGTDIELHSATVNGRECIVAKYLTNISITCDWSQ